MNAQFHMSSRVSSAANDVQSDTSKDALVESYYQMKPDRYGPAIAEQYAAMVARYWRAHVGRFDHAATLDILDLCPGEDASGALLISAIRRRMSGLNCPAIRYLPMLVDQSIATSDSDSTSGSLWWHLDEAGRQVVVHSSNRMQRTPYCAHNPLVVMAHDAWAQLPQELFAIHYGKLLRANLSVIQHDEPEAEKNCWEPVDDLCWSDKFHPLLAHYRLEFNSSPLVYPQGALSVLDPIPVIATHGALILSCSEGCGSDHSLRLTSFGEVTAAYRQKGRLPTNFRFPSEWAKVHHGVAAEVELPERRVLQILLLGDESANREMLEAVRRCVDVSLLASAPRLAEVVRAMGSAASLDLRLGLLHMSRFDPTVFRAGAGDLLRALSQPGQADLRAWRDALERVWQNHRLCRSEKDVSLWIAQAAMHCGHWGLARRVLLQNLAERSENPDDLANLAWCEARTGKLGKAIELVTRALAMDPLHSLANEVSRRLGERLGERDGHWNVELHDPALPIVLEPLDASHAPAFSHQYRDGQIAVMTGLPMMSHPDKVRQWIAESQHEAGRVNYAVMHRDFGFVAFINLAVSGHSAFFCFWTGVDFQGQGFATAAGRLACRHAAACGVPLILTSAYKDNHRSVRALKRLGFEELSIRAQPPDHERIFFAMVDDSASQSYDGNAELVAYYRRENLPMEFVMPGQDGAPVAFDTNLAGSME